VDLRRTKIDVQRRDALTIIAAPSHRDQVVQAQIEQRQVPSSNV